MILASSSPRRCELLNQIGVPYQVQPANIDETPKPNESPTAYVQRMALEKAPWSASKLVKRTFKHSLWIGIALLTGVTFVSYFYGIRELLTDAILFELPTVAVFWCAFFTAATYINAGWMREQVCKYMCPYARFQSAMFDKDTLLVAYDKQRGEQRGGYNDRQPRPTRDRHDGPSHLDTGAYAWSLSSHLTS